MGVCFLKVLTSWLLINFFLVERSDRGRQGNTSGYRETEKNICSRHFFSLSHSQSNLRSTPFFVRCAFFILSTAGAAIFLKKEEKTNKEPRARDTPRELIQFPAIPFYPLFCSIF
jgi:hypothetical protein